MNDKIKDLIENERTLNEKIELLEGINIMEPLSNLCGFLAYHFNNDIINTCSIWAVLRQVLTDKEKKLFNQQRFFEIDSIVMAILLKEQYGDELFCFKLTREQYGDEEDFENQANRIDIQYNEWMRKQIHGLI